MQGVGYRNWLQSFAIEYGVFGWVKNNVNGDVEAVLIGQEDVVSSLIEQCYMGPPNSNVEKILIEDSDDVYELRSFEILADN